MGVDRDRLKQLLADEEDSFRRLHPRSSELAHAARSTLLNGVPMNWMTKWPGDFPLFLDRAEGARLVDVDGIEYVDFCLGDTGAMAGHSPAGTVEAVSQQVQRGITAILPTADAISVGEMLTERFGLGHWQIAMTATDANRFVLRLCRQATGRQKILVFNWCYHGTVDETMVVLDNGEVRVRDGVVAPPFDAARTTKVVEFNDLAALEAALRPGDVACVLAEPALTNIGIVLPDPGFHDELRRLTRETGTLLVIDETHTICAGPGGYTRAHGLDPDLFVIGKPIAGGVPAAAYGMTDEVASRVADAVLEPGMNVSGVGGTLSGNALAIAAINGTLSTTLTAQDFDRMDRLAARWTDGVLAACEHVGLDWSVTRLGARAEYSFSPPPRTGGEAAAAVDDDLDSFLHLWMLNRGLLMTPFHNMALMSPATSDADVDRHSAVFADAVGVLMG